MALTLDDPARIDLKIVQGAAKSASYAWVRDGVRLPLDSYAATAQVRTEPAGRLIADLTPYLTVDVTEDLILLDVPATATDKIDRDGVWDLFLTNTTDPGDAVQLIAGSVKVKLRVTRV